MQPTVAWPVPSPMPHRDRQAWSDSYTLLCERCGYVVEGLPKEAVCPECGKPVAESLPDRRRGTPWQQRRGLRPMLHTAWLVHRRPLRVLDVLAVGMPRVRLLLWLSALPMSLLLAAGLLLLVERERPAASGGTVAWHPGGWLDGFMLSLVSGLLLSPLVAVCLYVLTWIEARGLVLFSAQHGTRMHRELAHTITRHGAAAWLVCGFGAAMALPLAWNLELGWRLELGGPSRWTFVTAGVGAVIGLLGFLYFECFAWLGLRRCKFANRSPR